VFRVISRFSVPSACTSVGSIEDDFAADLKKTVGQFRDMAEFCAPDVVLILRLGSDGQQLSDEQIVEAYGPSLSAERLARPDPDGAALLTFQQMQQFLTHDG